MIIIILAASWITLVGAAVGALVKGEIGLAFNLFTASAICAIVVLLERPKR